MLGYINKQLIIICLLSAGMLICWPNHLAAQAKVLSIEAVLDKEAVVELYDQTSIGFIFHYNDGSSVRTEGLLKGPIRWKHLSVSSPQARFKNGVILINREASRTNHHRVHFDIEAKDAKGKVLACDLAIPYLDSIRFNHYTDSLKLGIRYYLNVEGIFSSGKIFPLDTNRVRFETSAGKIIGHDLLVDPMLSEVKFVKVRATLKSDPQKSILSDIPVKQGPMDTTTVKDPFRGR